VGLALVGLAVIFGLRAWLPGSPYRLVGLPRHLGEARIAAVVGRLSFVAAHVLGVGTLVLAVVDVVSRPSGTVADTVGVIGLVLALRGFAGVLAAQTEMPTTSLRCA
jgi:hypothetical protein